MFVVSQLKKLFAAKKIGCASLAIICGAACGEAAAPSGPPISLAEASVSRSALLAEDAPLAPQMCNFEGTWALRVKMPVEWQQNMAMQAGSGDIIQYARVERVAGPEGGTILESIRPCGITVPSLQRNPLMGGGDRYLFAFSNAIFDEAAESFQPAEITSRYAEGFHAGAEFLSDYAALELGVGLDNPLTDSWPQPANRAALLPFGRQIGAADDLPLGMPSRAWSAPPYRRPLMGLVSGPRLKTAYFAMRNVERITARHVSCDRAEGTVEVRQMGGGTPALNLALLDCLTTEPEQNSGRCTPSQIDLFNNYLPQMLPKEGSQVSLIRLDRPMTCRDIKKLDFNSPAAG